jgi:hypothetical protein
MLIAKHAKNKPFIDVICQNNTAFLNAEQIPNSITIYQSKGIHRGVRILAGSGALWIAQKGRLKTRLS